MGKALTGMVYSLLGAGILIAINKGWIGNWPVTLLATLLGAMFVVAAGLLMGGMFRNTHQVNTWSSIVMLAMILPTWSGMMGLPTSFDIAFRLIPTYYLGNVLGAALAGEATLANVGADLAILGGCVVILFGLVVWTLKREAK
jgi:ABC-type Na+ efflux pump permease subunit